MNCSTCGATIPDGSKFCQECGAIVMDPTQALAQVAEATGVDETQPTVSYDLLGAGYVTPSTVPDQPEKKRSKLIALVVALAVTALAVAAILAWQGGLFGNEPSSEPEPTPAEQPVETEPAIGKTKVSFSVDAAYYDEPGSRLPIQFTGTTVEGETVNKTIYITIGAPEKETVELEDGTYSYEAVGSPISANGVIYDFSDVQGGFTLNAGEDNVDVLPAIEAELAPVNPLEVTDEQIEAAVESAAGDEECADIAEELGEAATQLRDEYVKAAEEEAARKAAEEEAARKAAEEEAQRAAEEAAIEASSPLNTEWFYIDNVPAGWTMTVTPLSDTEWEINVDYGYGDGEPGNKSTAWIKVSAGNGFPLSAGSASISGYMPDYQTIAGASQGSDGFVYTVFTANVGGVVFDTSGLAGGGPTIVIKNPA